MSQPTESTLRTLLSALVMCAICSAIVATAAVMLKPRQTQAKENDRNINILQIGGLYEPGKSIAEQMEQVTPRVIDFDAGTFTDAMTVAQVIDPKKLARYPDKVTRLGDNDVAKIIRRENYGVVYVVEKDGKLDRIILPIRGYGLWSTLWGFVALEPDLNTVIGLGFYQHAETPGLGGEVDNPKWKALWPGKKLFASTSAPSSAEDGWQRNDQGPAAGYVTDGVSGASYTWRETSGASAPAEEAGATWPVAIRIIKGTVNPGDPAAVHQVDGLSGATLTSRGVHNMLQFWLGSMGYGKFLKNLKEGRA